MSTFWDLRQGHTYDTGGTAMRAVSVKRYRDKETHEPSWVIVEGKPLSGPFRGDARDYRFRADQEVAIYS